MIVYIVIVWVHACIHVCKFVTCVSLREAEIYIIIYSLQVVICVLLVIVTVYMIIVTACMLNIFCSFYYWIKVKEKGNMIMTLCEIHRQNNNSATGLYIASYNYATVARLQGGGGYI